MENFTENLMDNYEAPSAELIQFGSDGTMNIGSSGCNCSFWQVTNNMDEGQPGCMGRSAHASENPSHIAAPDYGNW